MGDWFNQNAPKAVSDKPAGDWFAQNAPAKTPEKQGFVSAFWEGIGGKAIMDLMGGASRDPARAQKSIDTLKGLASGLANEGPRIMGQLDAAGEAIRKGDWGMAAHHAAGAAPLFGAAVQNAGAELERGDTSAAAGHTAALFAPFLGSKVPPAARAAADTEVGAGTIGAVKGAGKALVETKPITLRGVEIPVPTTVASAAAGGQAASMMGIPRAVGTVAGAAAPLVRGAVKGWRQALVERALTKDAAKIPPDVMAELTRFTGAAQPAPAPQSAPAMAHRRLGWTGPEAPPIVEATPPAPPSEAALPIPVEPPPDAATVTPAPRTIAQNEAAMMQKGAPPLDPQQSQFHANGEAKSPEFRAQEKIRGNTTAKATRWADALEGEQISPEDARNIEGGRVSDAQLQQGAAPRWENVKDYLIEKGLLQPGETVPKSSMPEIIAELQKRAKATPATSTKPVANEQPAEQIMKALADAMEEPSAAPAPDASGRFQYPHLSARDEPIALANQVVPKLKAGKLVDDSGARTVEMMMRRASMSESEVMDIVSAASKDGPASGKAIADAYQSMIKDKGHIAKALTDYRLAHMSDEFRVGGKYGKPAVEPNPMSKPKAREAAEALAKAMEEDKPKAAAAGKGK